MEGDSDRETRRRKGGGLAEEGSCGERKDVSFTFVGDAVPDVSELEGEDAIVINGETLCFTIWPELERKPKGGAPDGALGFVGDGLDIVRAVTGVPPRAAGFFR